MYRSVHKCTSFGFDSTNSPAEKLTYVICLISRLIRVMIVHVMMVHVTFKDKYYRGVYVNVFNFLEKGNLVRRNYDRGVFDFGQFWSKTHKITWTIISLKNSESK